MALISALLVRNEAGSDRYLARVLDRCATFSDQIVVLDDGSTDGTPELCAAKGCQVTRREAALPMWGRESHARAELWDLAVESCRGVGDWVLWCDADMVLHGDPRPLCGSRDVTAWAWPLFDVWDEAESVYREDQWWVGHRHPRVWLVAPKRVPEGWVPEWPDRGLHCGHLPSNLPMIVGLAPDDVYWLHLGWSKESHRKAKHQQYLAQRHVLTPHEIAHAQSILDA